MSYVPRPGSTPARVIDHLREHGGMLTSSEIAKLLGTKIEHVRALLAAAVSAGAIVVEPIDARRNGYRLPDRTLNAARLLDGAVVLMNAHIDGEGSVCLSKEQAERLARLLNEPMV